MNAIEQAKQAMEEMTSLVKQRYSEDDPDVWHEVLKAESALAALSSVDAQPIDLNSIEQYRMQMAAISTAAIGYWKESDSIHPDYDTVALRDVAKLYAKYDELYKAAQPEQAAQGEAK